MPLITVTAVWLPELPLVSIIIGMNAVSTGSAASDVS